MEIHKIYSGLKQHFTDSTSLATAANPIYSTLETFVMGMSNDVSINARLIATALTYAGYGSIASRGRDLSRYIFNITDKTKESIQTFHDTAFTAMFNFINAPIFYYASGCRTWKEIGGGMLIATAFGAIGGGILGYAIDVGRDLTGIQNSERLPAKIKELPQKQKNRVGYLLIVSSVGAMALVYSLRHLIKN